MFRNIYGLRSIPATTETSCLFVHFLYSLYSFLQIRGVNKNYISGLKTLHYMLGPVVQSVVSLTSSLRVISLPILADSIHNILIFFAEKM